MMRLSSSLRRARWLVFGAWLLTLIPAVWLALTQSGHLTGGGFEVAGSQSLNVQYQLEDHFPGEGASPLALVAAPAFAQSPDETQEQDAQGDSLETVVVTGTRTSTRTVASSPTRTISSGLDTAARSMIRAYVGICA